MQDDAPQKQPRINPQDWQFLMMTTIAITVITVILLLLLF